MEQEEEVSETIKTIVNYINCHVDVYLNRLKQAVRLRSISSATDKRDEVIAMVKWTDDRLTKLGATVELCDLGYQNLTDGRELRLPPVILAKLGEDETKPTICVYGHLDVQPALIEDGWDSDPFELTEKDGVLYGRGTSDDKGPILCWLHAVEAYKESDLPLPVNVRFVFAAMEESDSEALQDLLIERKGVFFNNVDYVCVSDNYWLGTKKPCLTYGLRGICYFLVEVECAFKDLHSGVYGGCLNEATSDLIHVLNKLVEKDGTILIPHIMDDVRPVTEEEIQLYKTIQFNVYDFKNEIGSKELLHNEDKTKILMSRWRFPALSIHGIEGAFSDTGAKTVIPKKVVGKFSVRIVPDQDPMKVEKFVINHLNSVWKARRSQNKFRAYMVQGCRAWISDIESPNFVAARKAIKHIYGVEPDLIREGGSIPTTLTLQKITGKNVILIPIGGSDCAAHGQNEKLNLSNYIDGTKVLAIYMHEIAELTEILESSSRPDEDSLNDCEN